MKRLLLLLIFIPFIAIAQSKKSSSKKPPLIESITSDTVKGLFYQVLFSYDLSSRVIGITNKEFKITSGHNKKKTTVEQIIRQQTFEYVSNAVNPFLRKIEVYEFNADSEKWYLASKAEQYFLYENGKQIGDSTLLLERNEDSENWDEKVKKRIGFLKQTSKEIYHEMDLMKPGNDPMDDIRNIYMDKFTLTSQSNIRYDSSEHLYANHGGGSSYFTFLKYDSMINPLNQLNIANILVNEKICLYDGNDFQNHNQFWEIFRGGHYGNVDFSWYFITQNNPVNYFTTVNDQSSPFKSIFTLKYTYNPFKQPIYAKAQIKLVFEGEERFYKNHQSNITFRYKK